jgi:hypothetical protein
MQPPCDVSFFSKCKKEFIGASSFASLQEDARMPFTFIDSYAALMPMIYVPYLFTPQPVLHT